MFNETKPIAEDYIHLLGEDYYRISHYDQMPPFFMSLVSSADNWLFISSTGGLTAGRANADSALFPYETVDKIATHSEQTGSKTIFRVTRNGRTQLWEPFSDRYAGVYRCERHLYKNIYGNKLIFEEINHDLELTIRTAWRTGDRFGFIRSCWLHNHGDGDSQVDLLDGLLNILPFGATNILQNTLSNLLNAYKRNELELTTGLGIFALSAALTDRSEPSESLKATVVWQLGLDDASHLLCPDQLDAFRYGYALMAEQDVCGKAGAYLVNTTIELSPNQSYRWHIIADVNQDSAAIEGLQQFLCQEKAAIEPQIEADIAQGTDDLIRFVAAADGLQLTNQETTTTHHFANVLFNIMRGGIFVDNYQVERDDLLDFVRVRNRDVLTSYADWFAELPTQIAIQELSMRAGNSGVPDLMRLCYEYLPLTFSRRHGDPSRPWNSFSINLNKPDGSARLDYQGNWRDIFQNWEPLALSFPGFAEGMLVKFLNATTLDGYNPYRMTRDGIEWEVPEPGNPWANIGYWSDHQIIYLQKLLEIAEQVYPRTLSTLWNRSIFAYANIPYRLRPYPEMLADWHDTIEFDWEKEKEVAASVVNLGTDGRLLRDTEGAVIHVTLTEKLLSLLLAKLTNLAPEGGIWMNTQRPEWNDANNALVGKGLSVVTAAYLRRFIAFWQVQIAETEAEAFTVNSAVADLFSEVHTILSAYQHYLKTGFSDKARRAIMDELGLAATVYRASVYRDGLPPSHVELNSQTLNDFLTLAQTYIEHTLRANRRPDGLAHSYNILRLKEQEVVVENLYLMLEGQVAFLSSGMLAPDESLTLLQSLRQSALYRADQNSYMLYPHRLLPGFQQKNNVSAAEVANSELVAALTAANDHRLLLRDDMGQYHFNGNFRNAGDVGRVLDDLAGEPAFAELALAERTFMLDLFESTFNHRAFTGRSGTFFAYEGLGSIYWHMVSKLLLATQECHKHAVGAGADTSVTSALATAYYDIRQGLGFNKSPAQYGAFPTDPYSHTPMGGGARQPGMTGQVKEEILTRFGELGVSVQRGALCFAPKLLRKDEFLPLGGKFTYVDVAQTRRALSLPPDSLVFTLCQTPVIYVRGNKAKIEVTLAEGRIITLPGNCLDVATSQNIFARDGRIVMLQVTEA
ncbi:MAG: hypothetical protein GY759_10405 [Chloroflexi bacterium]|nr:hypothetical protein [Chloroflexota bacterium]